MLGMKIAVASLLILSLVPIIIGAELTVIPAHPPIKEIAKKSESAVIVLTCQPSKDQSSLEVIEVLKGEEAYRKHRVVISRLIPGSDPKALATTGFRELIFIKPATKEGEYTSVTTLALWPVRFEDDGVRQFKYAAHDYAAVKRAVRGELEEAQQAGSGQPATQSESKSEDGDKPQPDAEGRSR